MVLKIPKISVSTFFAIIPILYFNSCTFEFVKHFSFVLPIVVVCALVWLVSIVRLERPSASNVRNVLFEGCYIFVLTIYLFVGGQSRVSFLQTDLANAVYALFFMLLFTVYSKEQYRNDRVFILSVWCIDTVFSCLYSIYRLIDNPNLSRLLSTGFYHTTSEAATARGIVSFGVIYELVLVIPVIFFLIVQNKGNRALNFFLLFTFVAVLLHAQFLIAILLVCISIAFILFLDNPNNRSAYKLIRFLLTVVAVVFLVFSLPYLLKAIIDLDIFGYEINARLRELLLFFTGENLEGTDIMARFSQYSVSLIGFLSSHGLGKVFIGAVNVGSHSEWLDGFGKYGLIYALHIAAIFMFFKVVIRQLPNKKAKQLCSKIFVTYSIMSLTNTSAWAPITLGVCIVVPFLCLDKFAE